MREKNAEEQSEKAEDMARFAVGAAGKDGSGTRSARESGVHVLENEGFTDICKAAVEASYRRTKELTPKKLKKILTSHGLSAIIVTVARGSSAARMAR